MGNGPTLPDDLSWLDGFFTVGVNRILERFDPTVLLWLDGNISCLIEPLLAGSAAVPLQGGTAGSDLRPTGHLQGPDTYIDCKNSGVSAAYWAMTLGCRPIYLLGMSGTYDGTKTSFYGHNKYHVMSTRGMLLTAVQGILRHPDVHAVSSQGVLNELCRIHKPKGRPTYVRWLASLHIGQRADAAC